VRDLFTPLSRARYLAWRAAKARNPLEVRTATGDTLVFRPPPSTDLSTAYEIFLAGAYEPPARVPRIAPKLVVDLGANVGFSVLLWARRFPDASVLAFEPHPSHLELLYRHVVRNGLEGRIQVVAAAASDHVGVARLTQEENESRVVGGDGSDGLPVRVVDFFSEVAGSHIDFLKVDIEGGEFELLRDERFAALGVSAMVLEWHNTEKTPDGKSWCQKRLDELGYEVAKGKLDYGRAGVLWAWKNP
jgi:FkbM family methyltransferase